MDLNQVLSEIREEVGPYVGQGKVADYIPELANQSPDKFGMAIETLDGESYATGDVEERFTIQSISKLLALTLAFAHEGEDLWKRVGVEPTGNPFNSLIQLEYEHGKPRNPLINAGALVVNDILISQSGKSIETFLRFVRDLSGEDLRINQSVAESEKKWGHINRAMVNFMKGHDNIDNSTDEILDMYFQHCSLEMNCRQLAKTFLYLANHGINPQNGKQVLSRSQSKRLMALMLTCGFYDEAGEFAFRVGLPGKSGVGGGITAIVPGSMSIAVWSPALNKHGNSTAGIMALELFTTKTGLSVF